MVVKKVAKGKVRKLSLRAEKLVEGVLQGKSKRQAALDAGYSKNTANVKVYGMLEKVSIQARIQARIREAQIDTNEVIGTLVSHMRADLADVCPDDEYIQRLKESGFSHLIKEIETTTRFIPGEEDEPDTREVKRKIKIHDSQAAAKQLCNVFGLEKQPSANPFDMARSTLKEIMEKFSLTEEQAIPIIAQTFNVPESELVH